MTRARAKKRRKTMGRTMFGRGGGGGAGGGGGGGEVEEVKGEED